MLQMVVWCLVRESFFISDSKSWSLHDLLGVDGRSEVRSLMNKNRCYNFYMAQKTYYLHLRATHALLFERCSILHI